MRFKVIGKWFRKNGLILIIILCAAFLRLYRLSDFAMFLADQGRDALIIRGIATLEHFPAIGPPSSIGMVYLGPFFYYLVAPFLLLTGLHPIGLALGSAVLMIAGIIIAYIVIKRELGYGTALIFLILAAFSFQNIEASRFSWNPNLLPVFSFMTLLFASSLAKKPTLKSGVLLGFFYALSFQLHHLAAFLGAPIALIFLFGFFQNKKREVFFTPVIMSLGAFAVVSSPLILFDLKHQFLNLKNIISVFTQQNVVAGGSPLARLLDTNKALYTHVFQIPVSVPLGAVIVLVLVGLFLMTKNKTHAYLPLAHLFNILTFTWLFSLLSSPRHPHYFGTVYFSVFMVMAYCLTGIRHKHVRRICVILVIGCYLILNMPHYYFITGKAGNQMLHAETVASSMVASINGKPYNIATYPVEFTSEDTFVYFLKLRGLTAANREKNEVTDQMYVLCDRQPCRVLDSQSWNIDMFGKAKIANEWQSDGVYIYKLIHDN